MSEFLPIGEWADQAVNFLLENDSGTFGALGTFVGSLTELVEQALMLIPSWVLAVVLTVLAFRRVGWRFALFCAAAVVVIIGTGFWNATMATLALVISATLISLMAGVPLGIWTAKSKLAACIVRPGLDFMQTMPAFVYLIPAAMLFGLGKVPGVLATVIFAMPPVVRLTCLGIRQVNSEQVEAGVTFGCTPWQLLFKVQIPGALPSIMAGINQTIMMALSMVIIASMVGAGGLGNDVLTSISRLDIGLGFESGLAVVLLAIIVDRMTESFGVARPTKA
ncbi:ABC transporter permease [Aromatoleum petrolei]|uniref:ABC transporter permease subunit n=1 Tax=Aromatoleum petrolei TaxID=76116 RepID=A0ABX1MHB1_9RHOO|nr:proline/glycine betaine ABC transporter permease [Aromatoleum petrolei]NMF87338.1 ABC transporter permease subunit [Aromatoleum petrolei]QTQ38586.1 Putative glycine/betaine ABC transporter, permease protein [Aromatoleum petrolei]